VQFGAVSLLVDAGEPCSQRLVEEGIDVAQIDAVLITHGHSDHTGGLPMLLQSAWLALRTRPLPVYLPGELIAPLRAWLEAVYLPASLLGFPLEWRAWGKGEIVIPAPGVELSVFPTTHLDNLRKRLDPEAAGKFEVFGLDLRCAGRRIVFSSDLGSPADLLPVLTEPCDVLVCELSHFRPSELHAVLRGRPIGTLVFSHLAPELNGSEHEVVASAREALPQIGRILAVRDGERVEF
jgi:ribonuclease BN (tRNA processing enzyme)